MPASLKQLRQALAEISDLDSAQALLDWDQHTVMPAAATASRAEQLGTLARLHHQRLCSDELGRLIEAAQPEIGDAPYESDEASLVRVARRDWEKARRVPTDLRAEIARTTSLAQHAWAEAREGSDFAAFLPHLRRNLELTHRYAECMQGFEGIDRAYDALLDDFEPGMRTEGVRDVLLRLRESLRPLVSGLPEAADSNGSCLHGSFPVDRQRALIAGVVHEFPLPAEGWRIDDSVHPFATSIGSGDVRLTTRYDESFLGTAVWSAIHETGHCLYGSGLPVELARTPLHRSVSLGFDESQSRLWENWVGRGRPYMTRLLERLREHFPERFAEVTLDQLYADVNLPERSLIRVEADEVTYNLHIVIRFELELEMLEGAMDPADLPEAWNARYRDYLGIDVPNDALGVLQDVHWSAGIFGYFPTYSLGNVIAGQLWEVAHAEIADLDARIAAGELEPLSSWLRERLYRHGGRFTSPEMVQRLLGSLDVAPLVKHLEDKMAGQPQGRGAVGGDS